MILAIKNFGNRLLISYKDHQGVFKLEADYVIFAIGRIEQADFISAELNSRSSELEKSELLFFVGDVRNGIYRQTSIAVGDGVKAAMKIYQETLQ